MINLKYNKIIPDSITFCDSNTNRELDLKRDSQLPLTIFFSLTKWWKRRYIIVKMKWHEKFFYRENSHINAIIQNLSNFVSLIEHLTLQRQILKNPLTWENIHYYLMFEKEVGHTHLVQQMVLPTLHL